VNKDLLPALKEIEMTISLQAFNAAVKSSETFNLANIRDFNSLIAQSQKYNVPIFALTDTQIEQGGTVLDQMKENREDFGMTFDHLADDVLRLTQRA